MISVLLIFVLIVFGVGVLLLLPSTSKSYQNEVNKLNKLRSELQNHPAIIRDAVVSGTTVTEKALKKYFGNSESIGSNLKRFSKSSKFTKIDLDNVWFSNKLRNKTVHDNYQPTLSEAKKSLKNYISFIKKL